MLKKRILILLTAVLALLSAAGCGKEETFRTERTTEFQKFALEDLLETVTAAPFTLSDDGELFLAEAGDKICRYSAEGIILAVYENVKSADALCLMGQELFVVTYENQLLRISLEDGKTEVLADQFPVVQNLTAAGAYLYVHVVDANESWLKRVSPATGETQDVETAEGTLRAVYGSADGCLYYCTEQDGRTLLYEYREDQKTGILKYDLTERGGISSTLQTFVCEQDLFLYTSWEKADMSVFSLTEELYASVPTGGLYLFGRDVACAAGNVVYRDGSSLRTVYLGDLELKKPENEKQAGTIVVQKGSSGEMSITLDAEKIQALSGLKTKIDIKNYYSDAYLTELMAGNPDVDIFMISLRDAGKYCREGLYEPLNSSEVIQAYRDRCFPYLSEGMETETGNIWMLPLAVDMNSVWYVEENLEKFGVDSERLRTMDSFLELSKEMKRRLAGTEYYTYANVDNLGNLWHRQYTWVYCDIPNGIVDYKSEAYRKFFEAAWTGWSVYGTEDREKYPEHPYIERQRADSGIGWTFDADLNPILDDTRYSTEKMLYKFCTVGEHLLLYGSGIDTLEGWRVMPAPKFSEEVPGDEIYGLALVLNPNSRQKDLAMAYLEAVAEHAVSIYSSTRYTPFLFADIDVYREAYDVDLPAFRDLYQLFAGARYPAATGYQYYLDIVEDYQTGRLTLDEAIDILQREVDMFLNE